MARPVVPRRGSQKADASERRRDRLMASVLNSLVEATEIRRRSNQSGRDKWTIALSLSNLPAELITLTELNAALAAIKFTTPLFDHFADAGNTGTGEDDLYSDTLAAGRLGTNGDKLEVLYAGFWVGHATATRRLRLYFGGTAVLDTDNLLVSDSAAWEARLRVVRVSSSVVRVSAVLVSEATPLQVYTTISEITGLTLANTQVVKITGEAAGVGAANNDIVAQLGRITFTPAA